MDIKATQLKNTQMSETNTSTVRTPAKMTEEGKSFIDEMISLPKLENETPVNNAVVNDKNVTAENKLDNKSFEFVSTADNFNSALNKENLNAEARQAKHKAAEKELVDEIVLMNKQQNLESKNQKTDLKTAQASVVQKSDNQIELEKTEIKDFSKENKSDLDPKQKHETLLSDIEMSEMLKVPDNTDNTDNEIILPVKNAVEELFEAPENLVKFEDADVEIVTVKEPLEVFEDFSNKEINAKSEVKLQDEKLTDNKDLNIKNSEEPVILPKTDKEVPVIKNEISEKSEEIVKPQQPENKSVAEAKLPENKEQTQVKIVKNENIEKTEPAKIKTTEVEVNEVSQIKPEKFENVKIEPAIQLEKPEIQQIQTLQQIQSIPVEAEKVEKASENTVNNFIANIFGVNKKQADEKVTNKPLIAEPMADLDNVGKVKDIADDINVKAVDMKPVVPEDIKVIKMEVVNPLAELNNSLNTTKTSDIVKFIDANLSTETAKTSKTASSKAAEAAKKASSEKTIKMTEADAKFFNNLIETNQQVIEGSKTADQTNSNLLKDVETAQSAQVSKTLLNALKESQETNKSFRVDFDKDISVVLRVNKSGQISAEFIPGDEAVEQYLKANIPLLKQKFSDEGLEYDSLSYRQNRKENNEEKQRQRGNKKENGYE